MQRSDFDYYLPKHLIAQYPSSERTGSRLLYLNSNTGSVSDHPFTDFVNFLDKKDLLVFNDTQVIPARLFAHKPTGGKVEILVERILDSNRVLVQLKASKPPKPQSHLQLDAGIAAIVLQRQDNFFEIQFEDSRSVYDILATIGHIPLPPYIQRGDIPVDESRYQTVYAKELGAVAAPTAGLHFDEVLLARLQALGIEFSFVTLHVGSGTFTPVRVDDLSQHVMHAEYLRVSATVCEQVRAARARGGRVIAIGTTSVRALETASENGVITPFEGETRLFITPGYQFRSVDALLTNFHLPESTLLMLVCAFAGQESVLAAYRHAVAQQYRFFSYGDAMFTERLIG